jgi:hypothetical protein
MGHVIGSEKRHRAFFWFALVAILLSCVFLIRFRFKDREWNRTITSDGSGYYAYLPAFLLFQDEQYRFYLDLKNTYEIGDLSENFLYPHEGRYFNRYFAGTAIAMLPFFGGACLVQSITGGLMDGHHPVFVVGVHVAGLFYALAGLYALYCLLLRRTSPQLALLMIIALFFGTNLWNYAVNQPAYSHVYSFAFISFFLLALQRFIEHDTTPRLAVVVFCLGMIALIRPSNIIAAGLVPLFFNSFQACGVWLKTQMKSKRIVWIVLLLALFPAIQSVLYHAQCGAWWVDGYPYEHFNFLQPHLWEIWFHPRAGMLLYFPVLLLVVWGWWCWFKQNRFAAMYWSFFLMAATWIISSWWAWHYAGTIGMRALTDHLPWLVLPATYLVWKSWPRWSKQILLMIAVPSFVQGALVNYQAFTGILPHDHMNWDKYTYLLGETRLSRTGNLDDRWYPSVPISAERTQAFTWSKNPHGNERPLMVDADGCIDSIKWTVPINRRVYVQLTGQVRYASLRNESRYELRFYAKGLEVHRSGIRWTDSSFTSDEWCETKNCFLQDFGEHAVDEVRLFTQLDSRTHAEMRQVKLILVGYK